MKTAKQRDHKTKGQAIGDMEAKNSTSPLLQHENLDLTTLRFGCYIKLTESKSPKVFQNLLKENDQSNFELYFGIVCIILAVLNIVSNSCFIYGLRKTNRTLSHVQKLFIYLSATDLNGGCCVLLLIAIGQFHGSKCLHMSIALSLTASVAFHNGTTTAMISALRYKAIRKPMNKSRGKDIFKMVAVQNVFSFAIFCSVAYIFNFRMTDHDLKNLGAAFLPAILGWNIAILVFLLLTLNTIRRKTKDSELSVNVKRRLKRQKKSTNTLLIIATFSFICLFLQSGSFAYVLLQLKDVLGPGQMQGALTAIRTFDISVISMLLTTIFNSMLFALRSKEIRSFYIDKFQSKRRTIFHHILSSSQQSNDSTNV